MLEKDSAIQRDKDIDDNIVNVCRCATYYRMRKAIHRAAEIKNTLTFKMSTVMSEQRDKKGMKRRKFQEEIRRCRYRTHPSV